ncbi:MAG: TetR/AcrR family transcriptional regulator [Lachnospiraceae bacterium]|jgi:AcrR family transcriptional regulator|nr:TetR/AcrR family transcriptional regulator [Lachnospiraceae bacterium]
MPASDIHYVKKQITSTLVSLMEEKDFRKITVSALTKEAGVGRASFYRHFTDTSDVIRQYLDHLTCTWRDVYDNTPESEQMRLMLTHFYAHKKFYLALYRAGLSDMLRVEIQDAFKLSAEMDNCTAYLIGWFTGAAFGWIDEWIRRGMQETPEQMIRFLETFLIRKASQNTGFKPES